VLNVEGKNHHLDILFNAMDARDTIANDAQVVFTSLDKGQKMIDSCPGCIGTL